ncbi:MAG: efflux RND transporter periplasmic adaptor subunit [Desulfobacter sp.]|nr:MAG: efflux RND transporter periplasmic adaptor subunit [Desulfobacter sp.]
MEQIIMTSPNKAAAGLRTLIKVLLPLCFIAGGVAGFDYYKSQKVKIKRNPPVKHVPVVKAMAVSPGTHQTRIHAMGTVSADRQIVLKAQVAGEVVWVSPKFVQGGIIKQGEPLIRLESSDYRLAVDKAKSSLDKALADFEIEKGQQLIAREELKLISKVSPEGVRDTALALRKPQLEQARAAVAGARSEYDMATLNLARTQITIPFDALILEKNVDLGSTAAAQAALATLVDVAQYRVEAQVPLDRLDLLDIHESRGSQAVIRSLYDGHTWAGRVVRTTGKITGQSRMAGVFIRVADPLGLEKSPEKGEETFALLLGDHVETVIAGRSLDNVYALPRTVIRENNTIWVYEKGRLDIRRAEPVWKEKERVFVRTGLNPGDQVITSDIPVAVRGMALALPKGERS